MEKETGKVSRKFLVGKYVRPYLGLSLPLWAVEVGALGLLMAYGSAFCVMLVGACCLVVLPLAVLWHRLFSRWYPGAFQLVAGHVWLVSVALGVSAVWLVIGWKVAPAFHGWGSLLVVLPSLAVYGLGVGYVYFFGLRNETVYLRKKKLYRCPPPDLFRLLRTYLPAFGWCDLLLCFLSLLYVLCLEQGWVSEQYGGAILLVFAVFYAWASWRLMHIGRVYDKFGSRSYPLCLLEISGLLMMTTPMAVRSGQYAEAAVMQLFALTGYLNAFYFYEQKEDEPPGRRKSER